MRVTEHTHENAQRKRPEEGGVRGGGTENEKTKKTKVTTTQKKETKKTNCF